MTCEEPILACPKESEEYFYQTVTLVAFSLDHKELRYQSDCPRTRPSKSDLDFSAYRQRVFWRVVNYLPQLKEIDMTLNAVSMAIRKNMSFTLVRAKKVQKVNIRHLDVLDHVASLMLRGIHSQTNSFSSASFSCRL